MDKISELLKWVQRTNPEMTKERLIEELSKCRYSAIGLIVLWQNNEKSGSPYRS